MECRLDVRAASATEVIAIAGGWICDRAMAGWTVTVCIPEDVDARALSILGANAREWMYEDHSALHLVSDHRRESAPPEPQRVRHRLSAAARAFKAHALTATGQPCAIAADEEFWIEGPANVVGAAAPATDVVSVARMP